mgnify:CR=1 FL=1
MAVELRQNITGELTQELLAAGSNIAVSKISLCNVHASTTCTVDIYIEKLSGGKYYIMKAVALPVGVTLVQDQISFQNTQGEYALWIKLTKSASETPAVDVIIS